MKFAPLLFIAVSIGAFSDLAHGSSWIGGAGNWSSNANAGWNGAGVPNATGAIAWFGGGSSAATTQDIVAGVTLGMLEYGGSTSASRTINVTNPITFHNGGSGASIINSNTSNGTANRLVLGGGTGILNLADNLLISNIGNSTNVNSSITLAGNLKGTGNLTVSNVSNDLGIGAIVFTGFSSDFVGSVAIQKGGVTVNGHLGSTTNVVTLGSAGNSTTLVSTGPATPFGNSVVVAATTGTNIFGSNNTASSNSIFTGKITLNGNLSVMSKKAAGGAVRFTDQISGTGSFTTIGSGLVQIGDGTNSVTNTYTGNTILTESTSLTLSSSAKLTFLIKESGANNSISGTANQGLTLNGDFIFDLTDAAAVGSWTIVDVGSLNETFGNTFTIVGFTEDNNVWTRTVGASSYTFSEVTGVLSAIPEPSTYGLVGLALGAIPFFRRRYAVVLRVVTR